MAPARTREPPAARHLAWEEVARIHRSRWGISIDSPTGCARSILKNEGYSGYRNRWVNDRLHYQGEGRKGNQEVARGNAALLAAKAAGARVRVLKEVRGQRLGRLGGLPGGGGRKWLAA